MLKGHDPLKSPLDLGLGIDIGDMYVGKYYEKVYRSTMGFFLFNLSDPELTIPALLELIEIAKGDYPNFAPDNRSLVDAIVGGIWAEGDTNIYALSFMLDDTVPNDDYRPISDLFPLGHKFFS